MKNKITIVIFAVIISAGLVSSANAAMINYYFSGSGSGTLNSTEFLNKSFVVTITADTNDVVYSELYGNYGAEGLSGSITLGGGIGTSLFTDPLYIFGGNGDSYIGFGGFASNGTELDFINSDPVTAVSSYDLKSDFGPLSGLTNRELRQFVDIQTNNGLLSYTSMSNYTFEAKLSEVPLPASLYLFLMGSLSLFAKARGMF